MARILPCLLIALVVFAAGCTLPREVNVRHLDQHLTTDSTAHATAYVYTSLAKYWNSKNQSYLEVGSFIKADDTTAEPQLILGSDLYEEFLRFSSLLSFHRQKQISRYKDLRAVIVSKEDVALYFDNVKTIQNKLFNHELLPNSRVKLYLDKHKKAYVVLESSEASLRRARQDITKSTEVFTHANLYIGDRRHRLGFVDFHSLLRSYHQLAAVEKSAHKDRINAKDS